MIQRYLIALLAISCPLLVMQEVSCASSSAASATVAASATPAVVLKKCRGCGQNIRRLEDLCKECMAAGWECPRCTYKNVASETKCSMCGSVKEEKKVAQSTTWSCPACTYDNPSTATKCEVCGYKHKKEEKKEAKKEAKQEKKEAKRERREARKKEKKEAKKDIESLGEIVARAKQKLDADEAEAARLLEEQQQAARDEAQAAELVKKLKKAQAPEANVLVEKLKKLKQKEDEKLCIICMAQDKTMRILPCKHILFCAGCAKGFGPDKEEPSSKNCPTCRTPITKIVEVE